ncbi:MAG: thiamine pyrophosphate-binding protein [Planctomycetota bacterium]|nr:thiamine pyrophosphate-binding protein [Planctomycetota bacterium]
MRVATWVFSRLKELGVDVTFGLPGDFALPLYDGQAEAGMRTVTCTHEPGAAFAADAYSRLKGLGVALGTYGAGTLNMVNAVGMSYAEHTPLLIISGAPSLKERPPERPVHHTIRDWDTPLRVFRELTVEARPANDPHQAALEFERVVGAVVKHRRPGYFEIPTDVARLEIDPPTLGEFPKPRVDPAALDEAIREIRGALLSARRPVLYAGVGVRRFGLSAICVKLAETYGLPVVVSVLGKGVFPESHSHFAGVFMGALGGPTARGVLDASDCVLSLGVLRNDVNSGFWTDRFDKATWIEVAEDAVRIRHHVYPDLPLDAVVLALKHAGCRATAPVPRFECSVPEEKEVSQGASRLRVNQIIHELNRVAANRYAYVADIGDSWFLGLELKTDMFLAPGYYATMGYAVPAALGMSLAEPLRRPFVLVGDGAFQMTGCELSTLVRERLNPIILLLNNGGYMMLEALDRPCARYDLPRWDYVTMARAMGAEACRVETLDQFKAALQRAHQASCTFLIEAVLERSDRSPIMKRIEDVMRASRAASGVSRST